MTHLVLIAEDDPVQRRLLEEAVRKSGHEPLVADCGEAALAQMDGARQREIGVLILDLGLPDVDGLTVLERMSERDIAIPVIVQTAQGSIETVIAAMRAGAFDYVVKPVSPDRLNSAIAKALKVEKAGSAVRRNRQAAGGMLTFRDIVTASEAMERVIRLGKKAASSNIPILIEGESGVGKELIARAIGGTSERRSKPFVTVNCGAIPANLVESILFGHEKGAFTGATEKHTGKFVEAHTGTLFLDEIGDLPLDVQVKLLRAVQDGEVDPVGARRAQAVDIRLISATHRDLMQQVRDGEFREDLYYRLNVFPIFVPPLRARREDIPALVRHFIAKQSKNEANRLITGISGDALALLRAYDWPGNIRQLENAVLRAVVLCEGDTLTVEEFPQIRAQVEGIDLSGHPEPDEDGLMLREDIDQPTKAPSAGDNEADEFASALQMLDRRGNVRSLSDVEYDLILFAIEHYQGQMSEVARRLGIGRSTLYRKLKEYGIEPERVRDEKLAS